MKKEKKILVKKKKSNWKDRISETRKNIRKTRKSGFKKCKSQFKMRTITFLLEAEEEMNSSAQYYNQQSSGLGLDFLEEKITTLQ
ncbi:MAG: hypothetical protein MUP85_15385 [Candidatus Lokiarchaeota archaeon]|nr:hypothetical protein [Candidatus Lokiarchaeota archaeon]